MEQFNAAQLTAAIRGILLTVCGGFVTNGYMNDAELQMTTGLVASAIVLGYGMYKRRASGIIQTASDLPNVQAVITTTPQAANAVPRANVVGTVAEASRLPGVS